MKHVTIAVLVFICVAAWWLESRFGASVAIMVLGGALGVVCIIIGYLLSMANQKFTLHNAAMFNRDNATVERYRAATDKEIARGEREAFAARAKLDVIDAQRVNRLAQQQAKLLVDLERQRIEETKRPTQWAVDDDDDSRFSEWE